MRDDDEPQDSERSESQSFNRRIECDIKPAKANELNGLISERDKRRSDREYARNAAHEHKTRKRSDTYRSLRSEIDQSGPGGRINKQNLDLRPEVTDPFESRWRASDPGAVYIPRH